MRLLIACGLMLIATPAIADPRVFCVRDPAEFNRAWRAADRDDIVIRMATGTYDMRGSCIDYDSYCHVSGHDIQVSGGYNATCSSRVDDPAKTVLTAPGRTLVFGGYQPEISQELDGDVRIDRLTVRDATGLGFWLEDIHSANYSLSFDHVAVDRVAEVSFDFIDDVQIRNSVFSRGTRVETFIVDNFQMTHSTVVGVTEGLTVWAKEHAQLFNNVFWNNGNDLDVVGGDLTMVNNLLTTRQIHGMAVQTEVGSFTADPKFLDAGNADYRLAASSPAINRAVSLLWGSDHDGGPRVYGDAADLGAFESEIGSLATKLVVTNRNDSGPGSLRQALLDANALPDENVVDFAIGTGCGPQVIRLQSLLPEVREPVRLRGFTQPGSQRNTDPYGDNAQRCIVLDGNGTLPFGLRVATGNDVSAIVDGLAFGGFNLVALNLQGGNGHVVHGSQFGPGGRLSTLRPNLVGVQAGNFGIGEGFEVSIGGSEVGARNLVSGNDGDGIVIGRGSTGVRVRNNLVGVGSGDENRPNARGIVVQGEGARIRGNVVGFNREDGIVVRGEEARNARVAENRIGEPALCIFGCEHAGNGRSGVRIEAGARDADVEFNTIRNNARDGIVISAAKGHSLHRNRIVDNQQQPIDLGDNGTNGQVDNTAGTAPPGSGNDSINRPLFTSASWSSSQVTVTGTLASRSGRYLIQIFKSTQCDPPPVWAGAPAAQGRPDAFLDDKVLILDATQTPGNVVASFSLAVGGSFGPGDRVMAIATRLEPRPDGGYRRSSSSEVSNCLAHP